MTSFGNLWYLAEEAGRRAARARQDLRERYEDYLAFERRRRVSRDRFRTLAERIRATGAPYGAHTVVYRPSGELLLCRHEGVDLWVLPGGEVGEDESFRAAARRELAEEAGVGADYDGLAMVTRVELACDDHETWGVLPVFAARATETAVDADDPEGEISTAAWFEDPPPDTRDRDDLLAWRRRRFGE